MLKGYGVDEIYEVDIQNSFRGWPLLPYDDLTPVATIWPELEDPYIVLADLNTVRGTDIDKLREQLKVGPVALAKYDTAMLDNGNVYLKERVTDGWNLFLSHKSLGRYETAFSGTGREESLEIVEVKELYQAPVFPGLEPIVFVATFHYRGLLWGQPTQTSSDVYEKIPGRDEVDLTFDVKFNVYPKWVR
ncbi:hypothetical protein LAG90_18325 [Marinilongibacter aquaticus]|uniref:hypothetical protein n=1 Tax=Marinilongibacter aquaticus TaxID=2975157 RepID=UPI0021BD586A|nr:hypothetical protein [Marinilongibacter aquaticus]UBM58760.1 hypothetical protein LAG90_18325 [Marinilongibacter aquaticus]